MEIEKAYSKEEERKTENGSVNRQKTTVRIDGEAFEVTPRMSATEIRSAEDKKKFKNEMLRVWLIAKIEKSLEESRARRSRALKK